MAKSLILFLISIFSASFISLFTNAMISSFRAFTDSLFVSEELCDDTDCVICLCKIQRGKQTDGLRCRHVFHKQCFDEWVKKSKGSTCPLCRAGLIGDGCLTAANDGGGDGGLVGSSDLVIVAPFGKSRSRDLCWIR